MARKSALEDLTRLLSSQKVVEMAALQEALGGVVPMTVFRWLRKVSYRSSYNHNGRYYTLYDPARFDRWGLWSYGDVHFSIDGTLKATVKRLTEESKGGYTQRELQELLRARVQTFVHDWVRTGDLARERIDGVYVYLHPEQEVRASQLECRRERTAAAKGEEEVEIADHVVIQVLLVLIHHPGSRPADVERRLRGQSPPIPAGQVRAVFARYALGGKGGLSTS
jgi:hypothetical protein